MRKQLPVSNGPSTSTAPNPAPPLKVNGVKFTQIYDSHEMMSLEDNDVTLVNEWWRQDGNADDDDGDDNIKVTP